MLLKSLDIQGFKSFPDRTHIAFNSGVTVIVGPNGSGKSNISDAIRWVLGEQSTKALRGGKMEDVIFSGAGDRRAMAAAEVSLTIDNSSGFLKSEYNEVTVTRKYYRSGESEFFINRKAARLRDIHELFMDTGLGRDGYSMISQGKIDEILSVKSEQRREIFDEATGISKYRYRREEAEHRLADADANLMRIQDMIGDMSARLEPMRAEAEREQKYIDLQTQLKTLEVSLIMQSLDGIGERLAHARENVKAFSGDLEKSRAESARLDAQAEGLIRQTAENQRLLETLRDELRTLERAAAQKSEEIAVSRTQAEHIAADLARMEQESAESTAGDADVDIQLDAHRTAISDAQRQADLETGHIAVLTESAEQLKIRRGNAQLRRDAQTESESVQKSQILEMSGKLETSKSLKEELKQQLAALSQDAREREEALKREQTVQQELDAALGAAQEKVRGLENVQAGFRLKLDTRRRRLEESSRAFTQEKLDTAALESRLAMLRELEKDYEGFNRAVRVVMRESGTGGLRGIHGPVSALMKLEEAYIPAAETALGGAMQYIVVDSEADARSAIGLLKNRDSGRATFLPLTAIRPNLLSERGLEAQRGFIGILSELVQCQACYRPVFENLLGRTVLADNLDNAIALAKSYRHRFRIVTLDGQIINAGGSMTGGSLNRSSGILSRANEIEKLSATIPPRKQKLSALEAQTEVLQRETQALEYQLTQAQEELQAAQQEAVRLAAQRAAHATILENLLSGDGERASRAQTLQRRIEGLEAEQGQLTDSIARENETLTALLRTREELEKETQALEEKAAEAEADLLRARMHVSALEAQIHAETAAVAALVQSQQQAGARAARRAQQMDDARRQHAACLAQMEQQESQRVQLQAQCGEKSEAIRREVETQHKYEHQRIGIERLAQEENRRCLELERQSIRAQAECEAIENEEAALDTRLWDNYELTRSQAKPLARPVENRSEAERELEKYKRAVRALGSIYPGAIQEYQSLCQRHEFMSGQKQDAEVSKKEILDIIQDINSRMREIFMEQFAVIARSFTEIFKRIFGGGTAKIELSDPGDVLQSGIDIMVQPPGKQLKVLTLLSGGERALAAIALYFAIMTVRPAPFCVLDEIESALDEANVRLFGRYLREMSDRVQFIVISHRRGTMEAADMLYGVAMPRQGISRILALNVAEAEKEYVKD